MKRYLTLAICSLGLAGGVGMPSDAMAAVSCAHPDPAALQTTWQAFRNATLAGRPEQVGQFIKFPLKLLSPMDGEAPLHISRPVFVKNYRALFQHGPANNEIGLLSAMKKSTGKEYLPTVKFDERKCAFVGATRVEDYNFIYDKKTGWQIESLYYGEDYAIAKEAGVDRTDN